MHPLIIHKRIHNSSLIECGRHKSSAVNSMTIDKVTCKICIKRYQERLHRPIIVKFKKKKVPKPKLVKKKVPKPILVKEKFPKLAPKEKAPKREYVSLHNDPIYNKWLYQCLEFRLWAEGA